MGRGIFIERLCAMESSLGLERFSLEAGLESVTARSTDQRLSLSAPGAPSARVANSKFIMSL